MIVSYLSVFKHINKEDMQIPQGDKYISFLLCLLLFFAGTLLSVFSSFSILWLPPLLFVYILIEDD